VIAGVCGGIAERLRLDPVLVRVVFVASIFVGGVGVLVYALAWLLMPQADSNASLLDEALGRRNTRGRGSALALSILLVLVAIGVAGAFLGGDWGGPVLVILGIAAVVMLLRRGSASESGPITAPPNVPASAGGMASPPADATTTPITTTAGTQPLSGSPPSPGWDTQPAPPRPRERSPLFRLVMSAVLVLIGGLALADVAGAGIAGGTYIASALAAIGLGLLVGAWWGRSRGLIAVGAILALALPFATAHDQFSQEFHGPRGRVMIDAKTIAEGTGSYEHGAGEVIYDLSELDFTGLAEELNIDMGAGSVQVTLPPDVDVDVDANVGVGELRILDRDPNGGFGVETHVVDNGNDGPGGGQLQLNVDSGFGEVVVSRATA
jgi:phage shock protein PspC (stress-responsive transcriptional regulator)